MPEETFVSKTKLRMASEVISRLKWSSCDAREDEGRLGDDPDTYANAIIINERNTVMGYDCRINGPLEKCVQDYININQGGDIPEHRIQYFRCRQRNDIAIKEEDNHKKNIAQSFLWDRASRLDRLFGSGEGPDAPLSPTSLENAQQAQRTMKRIIEEKAIMAEEKAKRRSRQQARKARAAKKILNENSTTLSSSSPSQQQQQPGSGQEIALLNITNTNERHTCGKNCCNFIGHRFRMIEWIQILNWALKEAKLMG